MNLAIYSGYTGPGTETHIAYTPSGRYPAYFVSNNRLVLDQAASLGWQPIFFDGSEPSYDFNHNTASYKPIKIDPMRFQELHNFDYLYYSDDKVSINDSRMDEFVNILGDNAYAVRKHPWNPSNILYELTESMLQQRYRDVSSKMCDYITQQIESGLSLQSRMFACGTVLRNMKHPDTINIDRDWLKATTLSGGLQDQVSFFFTAQRFNSITNLPMDCDQ